MKLPARLHGGSQSHGSSPEQTGGLLLDRGWRYDLEVWFFDTFIVRGRIRQLRELIVERSRIAPGDAVLDVGCGTGNLALAASRRLAGTGRMVGIDPAPRQLARARSKARRARLEIDFRPGVIEELPFQEGIFDVVTSSLMMHHLPADLKTRGLNEIHRVLKTGGRLVLADFDYEDDPGHREQAADNGHGGAAELSQVMEAAGFGDLQSEHLDLPRQHRGWSGISVSTATKVI